MARSIILTILRPDPPDAPTAWLARFACTTNNGRQFSADYMVPLSQADGFTDLQIARYAWKQIVAGARTRAATLESQSPLVGQPFTPASGDDL